ncbi:unnamed protein product [Thlaspi arvense]|uniref:Uncharacterized protein n=1 Tax=Thlaspi arvense TaxID=13288 RepID=A0AAU9T4R6_THLAR|nr:unnamed protein product [Thlaspi arvense]
MEYDNEFWEPLIDDGFGGSNAVEFMCPPVEEVNGVGPGPRRVIFYQTNSAFDHSMLNGDGTNKDTPWKTEGCDGDEAKEHDAVGGGIGGSRFGVASEGGKPGDERADDVGVAVGDGYKSARRGIADVDSVGGYEGSGRIRVDNNIRFDDSAVVIAPPNTKRTAGRRRESRYPSVGEIPVTRVKKANKCGHCGQSEHNRTSLTGCLVFGDDVAGACFFVVALQLNMQVAVVIQSWFELQSRGTTVEEVGNWHDDFHSAEFGVGIEFF